MVSGGGARFNPRNGTKQSGRGKESYGRGNANGEVPIEMLTEQERSFMMYKQEYTLLPTQMIFKVDHMSEYERNELLRKWELDKLVQEKKQQEEE